VRATKAATDAATEVRTPSGWAAKTPRTDVSPAATEGIAAPNIARLQKKLGWGGLIRLGLSQNG